MPAEENMDDLPLRWQREVLGYLNFSSGTTGVKFLESLTQLFEYTKKQGLLEAPAKETSSTVEPATENGPPLVVDRLLASLLSVLENLAKEGGAFGDAKQAEDALRNALEFRRTYHTFHQDLLWSVDPEKIWRPFFLGRLFETLLDPKYREDTLEQVRDRFDDYLGYRPIAILETEQKIEPYRNEWVRPVPLYIDTVGVACGPFKELIKQTLEILRNTDEDLLRAAWFDPDMLEELAVDPRAYDFDHPVHKRPNHHFGQWDPNRIDQKGFYRRFVLQPVVLASLMERVDSASVGEGANVLPRSELLYEAAAVLAGTILMASGVSGSGPNSHSSEETLSTLLPQIAEYRDRFYQDLIANSKVPQGERLREEARLMRQPFGGARQHLNHEISRRRALQLQKVQLARLFARMGRTEAALEQSQEVQVASARMQCEIYCRLTAGHQSLDAADFEKTAETLAEIESLIERGVACGAFVDPWNVVGFGGNFSLFPSIENTVRDYRVDDLIQLVELFLGLCSRAWTEAAAVDDTKYDQHFSETLERLSIWWDQFATPMVTGVRRLVAKEVEVSTNLVAGALNAWHKAGAASGDVGFWGMFVDQFDSPKAFQLVIEALLEKKDYVASMALLMRWLCQVELTPLEDGEASFHTLAERWLLTVESLEREEGEETWPLVVKFFDHLEANADHYWNAPRFHLGDDLNDEDPLDDLLGDSLTEEEFFDELAEEQEAGDADEEDEFNELQEDDLGLFDAAYDEVTYVDSTDDGVDASFYEQTDDENRLELEEEAERLESRLAFLKTVARLWKHAAIAWGSQASDHTDRQATIEAWLKSAMQRSVQLHALLEAVNKHRLSLPHGDHESMVEFDRIRSVKDAILEGVISTSVDVADARRVMRAAVGAIAFGQAELSGEASDSLPKVNSAAIGVLSAVLRGSREGVTEHWPQLKRSLLAEELLYVPIANGGDPRRIARVRALLCLLKDLLAWLPRLGMIAETNELLAVAQEMEAKHPVGQGAVTEFDRLFETGYESIVRCLVGSASSWGAAAQSNEVIAALPVERRPDGMLVQLLQELTELQLERWLNHSRTVRLSVVERLAAPKEWDRFVRFVDRYGEELFTQRFLTMSNLRAILHQGVGTWLDILKDDEQDDSPKLIRDLDGKVPREEAVRELTLAIEAVTENYREYRDYNATTTQSDHGELLYTLIDFIRLRNGYDRVAWNLRPVCLAHKILIRGDRPAAAELWRRAVADRTGEAADRQLQAMQGLIKMYGVRIASVAERLGERFTRPLIIDRVRALVGPAMDRKNILTDDAFAVLRLEVEDLMEGPAGAGLDSPDWIQAIEEEVTIGRNSLLQRIDPQQVYDRINQVQLSWNTARQQIVPAEDDAEVENAADPKATDSEATDSKG